jgi:hypothetical protein
MNFGLFIDIFLGIYSYIFSMRVYFLSARPCALKINGEYLGETDGFERYVSLFPRERPFVEWLPQGGIPLSFFLTEDILSAPPQGIALYHARDFLVLYAMEAAPFDPLSLSASTPSVTVFSDGLPRAIYRNRVITLGEKFSVCNISEYGNLLLLRGVGAICALFDGEILFNGEGEGNFSPEAKELKITFPLHDFCGTQATCVWQIEEGKASLLKAEKRSGVWNVPILCRFLQDLLWGRESDLLAPELARSLPQLREYIGNYAAVFPSRAENQAFIACPLRQNVFTLKSFSADLSAGKISNLRREW